MFVGTMKVKLAKSTLFSWAVLGILVGSLIAPADAAQVSWSTTAPATDAADIFNFTGSLTDAGNVQGGDDAATFLASNQQGVGQTFTTGANASGYSLSSFSYQHVAYSSDISAWSVDSGWGNGSQYEIKLGTISGTTLSPFATQAVVLGNTNFGTTTQLDVAGEQTGTGAGEWWTFTFDSPLILNPNTTYAFSSYVTPGAFIELNGTNTNAYANGGAFSEAAGTTTSRTGDRVFHANLALNTRSVWNVDANGLWNTPSNWLGGVPANGSNPIMGNVITGDRTVTLNTNPTLNSLTFNNPIGDGDYFLVPATTQAITLSGAAEINTTGRHWLRTRVAGTTVNATGTGELILDAANTFGSLNVNDVSVAVTKAGAIPAAAPVTVDNNGSVRFFGSNNGFFGGTNGTGLDPNTNQALSGAINIVDGGSFIDFNDGANVTLSGVVSGAGSIGAQSGANLTLTGANTYTGVTNVFGATVTVSGSGTLGGTTTGTTLFGDGVVVLNGVNIGNEGFGLTGETQLRLNNATSGVTVGSALITAEGQEDGTQAKIVGSGNSTIRSNIHAPNAGGGEFVEIAAATGATLTLSGTLSADDIAGNERTYVFNPSSGANINVTGRITDNEVDPATGALAAIPSNSSDAVSVVKRGAGTLTISTGLLPTPTENDFWQASTVVEEGTLVVKSNGSGVGELFSNQLIVNSGATLDVTDWQDDAGSARYNLQIGQTLGGGGTINNGTRALGMFNDNNLSPGNSTPENSRGTLTLTNGLNISGVTTNPSNFGSLKYDLGNDKDTIGGAENDLLSLGAALTTSSNPTLNLDITPVEYALESGAGGYRLINHTGANPSMTLLPRLLNPANPDPATPLTTRQTLAVNTATAGQVNLVVSGTAASQTWVGGINGVWNTNGVANWSGTGFQFFDLDSVTFNGSGSNQTITVAEEVVPASVTITGSGANYNFNGNRISTGSVTVSNNAVATFNNTVDGNVSVQNTATLGGTGSLQDNVSVAAGGRLRVGGATLPSVSSNSTVSWNIDVNGTISTVDTNGRSPAGALAGVQSVGNWTGTWNGSFQNFEPIDMINSDGVITSIDMVAEGFGIFSVQGTQPGQDGDGSWNKTVVNGYVNAGASVTPSVSTITVSDILYSEYDIIAYFSSDVAGREGSVTDGTTSYFFSAIGGPSVSGSNAILTQATDTVDDATDPAANYARFNNLTGSSQTITVDIPDFGGLAAIQIVGDPGGTAILSETLNVLGDVSLAASSTLSFNIAGSGINDSLNIGGAFNVADGSILEVLLDGSVAASSLEAGDTWDLLDFDPDSVVGSWDPADFILPGGLASGLTWNTANLLTTGELSVIRSGDFDNDLDVDGADFLLWQREIATPGGLASWQANYGSTFGSATATSSAVPEPNALLLLIAGLCGLTCYRPAKS